MSATDDNDRTVCLSNISSQIRLGQLRELFSTLGKITDLQFDSNAGTAAIEFAKPEGAKAAVFLDGTPLGDKSIKVVLKSLMPEVSEEEKQAAATAAAAATTASSDAASAAPAIAPITPASASVSVPSIPPVPSAPLTPFQALMMQNPALQALAAAQSNPSASAAATALSPADTSRTVYVGNISPEVNDQVLRTFFSSIGPVVATRFSGDNNGGVRYAFVEFPTQDMANQALTWKGRQLLTGYINVGKANTPITKPNSPFVNVNLGSNGTPTASPTAASIAAAIASSRSGVAVDVDKVAAAMERVKKAQEALAAKFANPPAIPTVPAFAPPPYPTNTFAYSMPMPVPMPAYPSAVSTFPADESKESSSSSVPRPPRSRDRSRSRSRSHSRSRSRHHHRRHRSRSRSGSRGKHRSHRRSGDRDRREKQSDAGANPQQPAAVDDFNRWGSDRADANATYSSGSRQHHSSSSPSSSSRRRSSRSRSRSRSRDRDRRSKHRSSRHHHSKRSSRSRSRNRDKSRDRSSRRDSDKQERPAVAEPQISLQNA